MRTRTTICAIAAAIPLQGCFSIKPVGPPSNPWAASKALCKDVAACTQFEALDALGKGQAYCIDLREYYERGGQVTSGQRLFVGVLGSLAGSVFAVASAGTASKAWAGLSGATNGIQTQIDQAGQSPGANEAIQGISTTQIEFSSEAKNLISAPDWNGLVAASVLLPSKCSGEAGKSIAAARIGNAEEAKKSAKSAETAAAAAASAAAAAASAAD